MMYYDFIFEIKANIVAQNLNLSENRLDFVIGKKLFKKMIESS